MSDERFSLPELQILDLLHEELSNAAIAERLILSPNTVKTHIRTILRKTGARSRHQAQERYFASKDHHSGDGGSK